MRDLATLIDRDKSDMTEELVAFAHEATRDSKIRAAQAVLQAECDKMTAALVAKGYRDAHTEIWIGWLGREVVVQIHPGGGKKFPLRVSNSSFGKESISEACEKVRETIAALPDPDIECDPNLCESWFAWPYAEAAE